MDKMTSSPETEVLREEVLAPARSRLLEIGFGTGRNIPHFPSSVISVVGLDPNPGVEKLRIGSPSATAMSCHAAVLKSYGPASARLT